MVGFSLMLSKWPIELFIAAVEDCPTTGCGCWLQCFTVIPPIFPAVCWKNCRGRTVCYWLTVCGWPAIGAGVRSLLHALADRIYCNKADSMTSIQVLSLYRSLSSALGLCISFCSHIFPQHLFFCPLTPSPSLLLLARLVQSSYRREA